ncbi:HNH endonuclease [Cohnella thailandensis]|uniref:HNH endonuclease n=1 Tax=Cohnella thailandensis TaxID=557557 RepID=A0A841SZL1_9BACL|nr:HNH endonuclease [Cohnella thailandensis]MBB6635685.1 HNH endonuclease [Cohnella thailandensis]MBP1976060.1 hypothetical protein [Cohnella thailandensis]
MAISSRTRKMLWGRAANRCAICKLEVVMDETGNDDESVVGDECHIVAREVEGPRGLSPLTQEQRDRYNNLILLCKIHHKQIDDQPNHFSVERLHEIKTEHEQWVRGSLQIDAEKQRDDELTLTIIDKWSELAQIDDWLSWTSWIMGSGQPHMGKEVDAKLKELVEYLFSRIYPQRYPEIRQALENFRLVLSDFLRVFHKHSIVLGGDSYTTEKFYRHARGYAEERKKLEWEFDFHVDLVQDLLLELTRAANYICDMVRAYVMPSYRLHDGLLIVESGPHMDFTFHRYRTEYRDEQRTAIPYPGLTEFLTIRSLRDHKFGAGVSIEDPLFIERQRELNNF